MSQLPSGTVTFLFTDIEGSTRLWEQSPKEMATALARHDEILRAAIETHGGSVFKTVGDAFCAVFSQAADACRAVIAIQKNIAAENFDPLSIKVRTALHSGTAELRDKDYFGPTLNRTARLLSVGHGGQILLSEACQSLVRDVLPDEASLISLGVHRLRDLGISEAIAQLSHLDLQSEFPPLKSLDAVRNSLPQYLSRFVGREKELSIVRNMVESSRLVTLTGAGGSGKTRLAVQAAADVLDHFAEGIWFIEFASLNDAALMVQVIAEALSIPQSSKEAPLTRLIGALKTQSSLLIFDNCEHVLDESARVALGILQGCPNIRILVTSREALGIDGERTYRVPSLEIPESGAVTASLVKQTESAQLFIDRARLSNPEYDINDSQAKPLASICCRLDGIPLALELAASRTRVMSIEQIEQNLDQRFRLLTGGSRAALPRQQTLRSMIDWSYDLLNDEEKSLFRKLSVFAGGWTLEAAEQVCSGPGLDTWEIVDLMASLLDKNLAVRIEGKSPDRYRYLETIRQYALDQLMTSGEALEVRQRHFDYFAKRAVEIHPNPRFGDVHQEIIRLLKPEQDNFEAAQEFAEGKADLAIPALKLASRLDVLWRANGRIRFALRHLESALELSAEPSIDRALGLLIVARVCTQLGEFERSKNSSSLARQIFEAVGDMEGVCSSLNSTASATQTLADKEEPLQRALAIAQEHGFLVMETNITANLAIKAKYEGNLDLARKRMSRTIELAEMEGDPRRLAIALGNQAENQTESGDLIAARSLFERALDIFVGLNEVEKSTHIFDGLAEVCKADGDWRRALTLVACAQSIRARSGVANPRQEADRLESLVNRAREGLSAEDADAAWQAGWDMRVEDGWALCKQILNEPMPTTP